MTMTPDVDLQARLTSHDRLAGSARTESERAVEKALAAVAEWSGRRIYWKLTVEGTQKRYFMKIPGAGSEKFIDRGVAN